MDQRLYAGKAYHSVQVRTASGPRLILMLYEGGLKAAGLARKNTLDGKKREAYKYRGNTVVDPTREWVAEHFRSRSNNSPWRGRRLTGRARHVLLRGRFTLRDEELQW